MGFSSLYQWSPSQSLLSTDTGDIVTKNPQIPFREITATLATEVKAPLNTNRISLALMVSKLSKLNVKTFM